MLEYLVVLILSSSIISIFIWIGFGKLIGLFSSVASFVFIYLLFIKYSIHPGILYFLPFPASIFIGYYFADKFFILNQKYTVEIEKTEENINLLKDKLNEGRESLGYLERQYARFSHLSDIMEKFSSTLSVNGVIQNIVESAYSIIGKSERCIFFRVDTIKQELGLIFSKKDSRPEHIKMKNGDMFDRWVFKKRQPLLVEDISRDFRFSLEGEKIDKGFSSVISAPLISEDKVLGILRLDSPKISNYTQEDLRLLDIISDLATVALENSMLYAQVSELAITDGLTSLYVQKYFKERLAAEVKRSSKSGIPFSLVMMDIDNFKDYNDRYGHTAGDLVLKYISKAMSSSLEAGDIAARYGGEEFALLYLGKDKKATHVESEYLRKSIASFPIILRREKTNITVSIGISSYPEDSDSAEGLIRDADKRLYTAKSKGKNQVCSL